MNRLRLGLAALLALVALPVIAAAGLQPYEKAKFESLLNAGKPVVVHVHADW